MGGGAFASVTVILSFAMQWHYKTASLAGKAHTLGAELSPSLDVPSLAHPEIAGP